MAGVMNILEKELKPGKNAAEIDALARKLIAKNGGRPSFLGYRTSKEKAFPFAICFSRNDEIVHGAADKNKIIQDGDLIKIDIGMEYEKMFTDMARTIAVGNVSRNAQKLLDTTRESLNVGIEKLRAGNKLSDYSKAVQKYVENNGFSVVRNLVGHGVGHKVHEDPLIPNYYSRNHKDVILKAGMVLALEPMVNEGGFEIILAKDRWTFKTTDGKLSAHFEDTVVVTEKGAEILTRI